MSFDLAELREVFGDRLRENVDLSRYSAAQIGGPATAFLIADKVDELVEYATILWRKGLRFQVIGGGTNLLFSDKGISDVVILNRAKNYDLLVDDSPFYVRADSGINFGALARQTASRGFSGLEWAAGIPGTVGGAVFGNAGAHGSDMMSSLIMAEILHRKTGREKWPVDKMKYEYRSSCLKRQPGDVVILSAELRLRKSSRESAQELIDEYSEYRHRTQPPGASMGSMFKNPPGDYAGRLIEAAGLKGSSIGGAQISPKHANFFVNTGSATAGDVYRLIELARTMVYEKFGVKLELEIELCGDW